jgi:peptide deformylase
MRLNLRYYGDPILRDPARPVQPPEASLRQLAADMLETMRASEGVGLAAQQVGETRSICVVEVPEDYDRDEAGQRLNPELTMPLVLLNPQIHTFSDKTDAREEGCLSFPDIRGKIERSLEIGLRFLDLDGQPCDLAVRGFAARVIQHEVDHLNGVLFIDRMSVAKRFAIKGRLAKMKKELGVGRGS